MKSEIRSIRVVHRPGPPSDPSKGGLLVTGKRPDNRTSACRVSTQADGTVVVSSTWKPHADGRSGEPEACHSEFTAAEWAELCRVAENLVPLVCNRILDKRQAGTSASGPHGPR